MTLKDTTPTEPTRRTYGHWHPGKRAGLFGLGPYATGAGLGVLALVAGLLMVSRVAAVVAAVVGVVVLAPLSLRLHGRTLFALGAARVAWWWGRSKRQHLYRSGIASRLVGEHRLPGVLAASHLYGVETGRGGQVGIIVIPQSRHYTAVFRAESEGIDLVDQEVIDARVARLASWLGSLAREPDLAQAQIIVETAPDPGTRLAHEVHSTMTADAPVLAREVLAEVVASYPASAAMVTVYVAVTFHPSTARRVTHEDYCRQVQARLAHLQQGLDSTGATGISAIDPGDLIRIMRTAYDPAAAADAAATPNEHLSWDHAGPKATRESWDTYRHDSGWSRTWEMQEAPRGSVFAETFARMAGPDPGLLRKRVSMVYRLYTPEQAARLVENDKRDARFLASKKARPSARDEMALAAAEQAALEEAQGAGVTRFTTLVTVTAATREALADAEAEVKARAGEARFALRAMYGAQPAAFAGNLPAGVVLPVHSAIPTEGKPW